MKTIETKFYCPVCKFETDHSKMWSESFINYINTCNECKVLTLHKN